LWLTNATKMKYYLSLTILCSLLCFNSEAQQTINASITHDGLTRNYILYVPANYSGTEAVPLLFNFHGYTSNAYDQMWYGDFRGIADTAGFLIIHPQGTEDGTGTTHFNVGWGGSTVDDVGFTAALIDSISAEYNINQDRVYSTGMSNGGFMSFKLACELSDRIAGIASVTGSILPATLNNCNASHSTPIMQIHGTSDATVPYGGGAGWTEPIVSLVDYWAGFNNCDLTAVVTNMPDINTSDGTTVEKFSYLNGDNCTEVIHYKVANGSHTWPGTAFSSAGTNHDIDASVEVWNFLSKYDINGLIAHCSPVGIDDLSSNATLSVYPNPAENLLQIKGLQDLNDVKELLITDMSGARVLVTNKVNTNIDISELSSGMYIVCVKHSLGETLIKFAKD
jgi:polyhydroxybutyrate depolymerase